MLPWKPENLELWTLRLNLVMKGRDFATKYHKNENEMGPQIFGHTQNYPISCSFHRNSEKLVLMYKDLKAMLHIMEWASVS